MQASNFGGTFDQLFLWIFYETFTEDASLLILYHGAIKVKNDQKLKSRWFLPEGPRVVIPKLFAKKILFWKLVFPWVDLAFL